MLSLEMLTSRVTPKHSAASIMVNVDIGFVCSTTCAGLRSTPTGTPTEELQTMAVVKNTDAERASQSTRQIVVNSTWGSGLLLES